MTTPESGARIHASWRVWSSLIKVRMILRFKGEYSADLTDCLEVIVSQLRAQRSLLQDEDPFPKFVATAQ